jgi:hypothetical protein
MRELRPQSQREARKRWHGETQFEESHNDERLPRGGRARMLVNMSEAPNIFEITVSSLVGAAYFLYAWHKKRTQFGRPRAAVRVYASDRLVRCHVCEGDVFQKREALINTTWVSLFKLDPLNESAHCLVCHGCGHMQSFAWRRGVSPGVYLRYEEGQSLRSGNES